MCTSVQQPTDDIWSLLLLSASFPERCLSLNLELSTFQYTGGQQDPVILPSPARSAVVTGVCGCHCFLLTWVLVPSWFCSKPSHSLNHLCHPHS